MKGVQMGKLLEKLKGVRRDQWLLVLLAGVLAVVAALPEKKESASKEETPVVQETSAQEITEVESRLQNILSRMEGAGRVRVMITQKTSKEKVVEKDTPVQERSAEESGQERTNSSAERQQGEATVYAKDRDGSEEPYVVLEIAPQVEGVLVLAEGGDNALVAKNITDAVMALFGLEAHKIKVMKMN